MKIFSAALLSIVCLSVMETVIGYAISIKTHVVVNNEGHNEDSSLHLVLDYVIGRQHKSCSNETAPQQQGQSPIDHSTLCGSDQRRIDTTITLCPVVNISIFTSTNPTSSPVLLTPIPTVCKTDFIRLGDQCYFFNGTYRTWNDALSECKGFGATMAHPQNAKENSFIVDHIRNSKIGDNFWLGGTSEGEKGRWVWAHDKSPIVYNDWGIGRPSGKGQGYCAYVAEHSHWIWYDGGCDFTSGLICQQ